MQNEKNTEVQEKQTFAAKMKNRAMQSTVVAVGAVAASPVFAGQAQDFDTLKTSVTGLIQGGLGKSLALIALFLGGAMGLAKSSAWPALTGLALAAVFAIGPYMVEQIFIKMSI